MRQNLKKMMRISQNVRKITKIYEICTFMYQSAGSIIFWDPCLWHRVGEATSKSRWGIFNTYGPWFVKPYHQFHRMFKKEVSSKFSPEIRQLLHFDSTPPKDHNEKMATLRRVNF